MFLLVVTPEIPQDLSQPYNQMRKIYIFDNLPSLKLTASLPVKVNGWKM